MSGLICFLSDFGLHDGYVGVVKGVILSIDPVARIVDLSHAVPPQDVRSGAFLLMASVPYFPRGTVYLAVVDPGVGGQRRAIAIETGGYRFVGPDNGLFGWALLRLVRGAELALEPDGDRLRLGEGASAVSLSRPRFWRPEVSATFHGRDVFGPVAAHLSRGVALDELGERIEAIRTLPFPRPVEVEGQTKGEILYVDRFGNLITNLEGSALPPDATIRIGDRAIAGLSPHFQQDVDLIALIGSSGLLEIAVPSGSAAARLGVAVGAIVSVSPAPSGPGPLSLEAIG